MNTWTRPVRGDRKFTGRLALWAIAAALPLAAVAPAHASDTVVEWNQVAGEAAKLACISPAPNPFHESRMYAMAHIAVHDALNAIQRRYESYAYDALAPAGASPEAATAAAMHAVMSALLPEIPDIYPPGVKDFCVGNALALVAASYTGALAAVPDGAAKDGGIAVGEAAAAAILAHRAGDGADAIFIDPFYPEGTTPGGYRFTEGLPFVAAPLWGEVTPFGLDSGEQFRPPEPYRVSCARPGDPGQRASCRLYAREVDEVRMMGTAGASGRSADQTQVATFWIESSPLAWNRMGRAATGDFGLDAWDNARLFALLNIALADGYIASMNAKYHYNYWRPETAIRLADSDGNPHTIGDPGWMPLDPTPPVPDYPSAHSVEGAAAAEVFRRVFQSDFAEIAACSLTLPDPAQHCGGPDEVLRHYSRFSDAANENGESRVLVGYHFRLAVEEGLKQGRKIGAHVVKKHLAPAH
jgi:hypothetical protein